MKLFRQFLLEAIEVPNTPRHNVFNSAAYLHGLTFEEQLELAHDVAKDVLHFNDERTMPYAQNCIRAVETVMKNPTEANCEAAQQAYENAVEFSHTLYQNAANDTFFATNATASQALAAAFAAAHAAGAFHNPTQELQGVSTAIHAAATTHVWKTGQWDRKTNESKLAQYKKWAQSYKTKPHPNTNFQSLTGLLNKTPDIMQIGLVLDALGDMGKPPSIQALKAFGVTKPGDNNSMAQQIFKSGRGKRFFDEMKKHAGA